jgi:hypothetical protein
MPAPRGAHAYGAEKGSSRREPGEGASGRTFLIVGGVVGALVLVLLIVALTMGSGNAPNPGKRGGKASGPKKPVQEDPAPIAKAPTAVPKDRNPDGSFIPEKPEAVDMGAIREATARHSWRQVLDNEGKLTPAQFRKSVEGFLANYRSTSLGKEAEEKLKSLPAPPPEPEKKPLPEPAPKPPEPAQAPAPSGESKTLWSSSFDQEGDFRAVSCGAKDSQTPNGTGFSVKAAPNANEYFLTRISINPGVDLGSNSWVRVLCRLEGTRSICFHSAIGDRVYERYVMDQPQGKWIVVVFRVSEYGKCITQAGATVPAGARFIGTAIFGCKTGGDGVFYVKEFTLGDGPLPESPK